MSVACDDKRCVFYSKEKSSCKNKKCCLDYELTDFLLASQLEIFETFITKAKMLRLDYICEYNYYLYIKGTNIGITSHVDTVDTEWNESFLNSSYSIIPREKLQPKTIVEKNGIVTAYRNNHRTILGGDDRCGVTLCFEQLSKPIDKIPSILLFNGEETGGIGVTKFCDDKIDLKLDLILSLDSCYNNEFVWYGNNRSADEWIESFGWKNRGHGIFSDITILGHHYDMPCVNLGCGYFKQHTNQEYIDLEVMNLCRSKLNRMLEVGYVPVIEVLYEESTTDYYVDYDDTKDYGFISWQGKNYDATL